MQDLIISLVQMQATVGQQAANLAKMAQFARQAQAEHADLICFPEMAVTGYDLASAAQYAEPLSGDSVSALKDMARRCQLTVVAGLAERGADDLPYITQLMVQPSGETTAYRKTHLGLSERRYFQPGKELLVLPTEKAVIGTALCWEMHFPEVATTMALSGCELILAPHASPQIVGDRKEIWMRYMPARAYDNNAFVAVCNLIGDNGQGGSFCGGLLALDPRGRILAEDFSGQEGLLSVQLPSDDINRIRGRSQRATMRDTFYLKARRPELYKLQ